MGCHTAVVSNAAYVVLHGFVDMEDVSRILDLEKVEWDYCRIFASRVDSSKYEFDRLSSAISNLRHRRVYAVLHGECGGLASVLPVYDVCMTSGATLELPSRTRYPYLDDMLSASKLHYLKAAAKHGEHLNALQALDCGLVSSIETDESLLGIGETPPSVAAVVYEHAFSRHPRTPLPLLTDLIVALEAEDLPESDLVVYAKSLLSTMRSLGQDVLRLEKEARDAAASRREEPLERARELARELLAALDGE